MADNDEVVIHWDPDAKPVGSCEVCGAETRSVRVKKCDDCKAGDKARSSTPVTGTRTPRPPRTPSKVTASKASGTFAKLAVIISAIWAWQAVKKYGIPDLDGSLSEALAFTDDEAADIAKPLARLSMSNSTTAKVIGPIVDNDDVIDALFAVWDWRKRVDQELSRYKGNMIADHQRGGAVNVDSGQDAQSTGESGGFDPLAYGYDAGRDARVI